MELNKNSYFSRRGKIEIGKLSNVLSITLSIRIYFFSLFIDLIKFILNNNLVVCIVSFDYNFS